MKHDALESGGLNYAPCRYGTSRLFFRGPKRPLDGRYLTFVGGTETYGKFIPKPYPALIEEQMNEVCINFGVSNGSIDAFMNEQVIQTACRDALINVVQVMGAQNMSNRFYTVHPRRNDRFLRASSVLKAVFPDVDFTDFCFTRHMLQTLHAVSPDRFEIVRHELEEAWKARMRSFLTEVGAHTILLWFAKQLPSDAAFEDRSDPFQTDPVFITRSMVDSLRPYVHSVVVVQPSARSLAQGTAGMSFPQSQQEAATKLLGVGAHREAAEALSEALHSAIPEPSTQAAAV